MCHMVRKGVPDNDNTSKYSADINSEFPGIYLMQFEIMSLSSLSNWCQYSDLKGHLHQCWNTK